MRSLGRSARETKGSDDVMTTLDELRAQAEAAQEEYERSHAQLFRDPARRQRLYSDEEHEARLRGLQQERSRKLDAVQRQVREAVSDAEREIATLEDGDPTALLGVEQLTAAAAKKSFVEDDVRGTPA